MSDPYVAEIRLFPFTFAPTGWAFCNGQLLPISQNTALFSLLGTTYGGNGISTFGLPSLVGQTVMAAGQGSGLSLRDLGQSVGASSVSLISSEMPSHNHGATALSAAGTLRQPAAGSSLASAGALYAASANATMDAAALAPAGGDGAHNNMQPYLALNFCIALVGIFPPRG